jgi:hypothetical protein
MRFLRVSGVLASILGYAIALGVCVLASFVGYCCEISMAIYLYATFSSTPWTALWF